MAAFFEQYFGSSKWNDGLQCQVCLNKCKIFAEFKRHIFSKAHHKKMRQVFQTEFFSVTGKLPHIIIMDRNIQLTIQKNILGLQLLTVCFTRGLGDVMYLCHACEQVVLDREIIKHLTSSSHERSYSSLADRNMIHPRHRRKKVSTVGALKILNLPSRLMSMCESLNYVQVMLTLSAYEKLPPLIGDLKLNAVRSKGDQEETKNSDLVLNASQMLYKLRCQNCNIQLDTPAQYFQHVQNEKHKMMMETISEPDHVNSLSDAGEMRACDHNADMGERPVLQQDIFDQLDKLSVPGASMIVFCHSSAAMSEAVCVCCACQDAFPRSLLIEHLNSHRHLLQTLLYLNPWRLPFGWKQVPGVELLQAALDAEEKDRGWSQVVIKVMDLPSSVLNGISPPSYQKVPPCRTFSQLHENNTYPLLGRNFMASHDSHDPASNTTYESLLCLLCAKRLSNEEGYAHAFSWQHVTTFLERFHPGSLTPNCGTKLLLDLATQAARIHSVSYIQKIKLDRPVKEPCSYSEVKLILSTAKRRGSQCSLIPIVLPQAALVPKEAVTSQTQERSSHSLTSANEEGERKRPRDAQDEEMGSKKQRSSTEMAPHEEKPKIKCENFEQMIESTSKPSSILCTTSINLSSVVAPTTSYTTKLRTVTTTTSCSTTKSCSVTATATTAKSTAPSASSYLAKRLTAPTVCNTKSSHVSAMAPSATASTRKSTAPAGSCTTTSSGVSASTTNSTRPTISHGAAVSTVTAPSSPTKPTATTAVHNATTFCITPATTTVVNGAATPSTKISLRAPQATSKPTEMTAIRGAAATKPTAPNTVHSATTSTFTATTASCAVSTSEFIASNSSPKPSFTKPPLWPTASDVGTEREAVQRPHRESKKKLESALKTWPQSHGEAAEMTAVGSRKSEAKKAGNLYDAEPRASKSHPCAARQAISTAKLSQRKVKTSKVGLSFIVVVNSDGRKQSYCTLCHIRLERSSHLTEDIHFYNYVKWRFSELSDEVLMGIDREKFVSSMAQVENCLGVRQTRNIDVTTEEYNGLSNLPRAQALQRLEAHFLASSNTLVHLRQQNSPTTLQGFSSPENEFDTESLVSTIADQTTELESTVHSIHGFKCGKEISEGQDFDLSFKGADENLECFEPTTSMSLSPEPQTDDPGLKDAEKHLEEPSPSDLSGPALKSGDPGLKVMVENLSDFSEPSLVSLDREPQHVEKNLEGSDGSSPPHLGPGQHTLSLLGQDLPSPACVNVERQSLVVKCKDERHPSVKKCVSQVTILSGNPSNLSTFLWVRGLSGQPVIGLASVYECRGVSGNSFYLCESCSKKLTVSDICQHMQNVDHQLAYMLKAFPHVMDSFWYDEDRKEEMKRDILNGYVIELAEREHCRKLDAKVVFLSQELYEHVWNAPFREALDMLQRACQPAVAQQTARSTSENLSQRDKNLCVADCVPSTFPKTQYLTLQKNHPISLIKVEPSIPSPISRTLSVIQVKDEEMRRPYENLDSVTKIPSPVFQGESKPIFSDSKSQEQAAVVLHDTGTAKAICETQPRFQAKADLRPPESGSDATAGPISEESPSFHVKPQLNPPESESFQPAGYVSEEQPSLQVNPEMMSQVYAIAKTASPTLGEEPGCQMTNEGTMVQCSSPLTTPSMLKAHICQVDNDLDPSSEPAPTSHVRDETLLMDNRSPVSSGCISKAQASSQMQDDSTRLEHSAAIPPASKMASCFQVKEPTSSEGYAPLTTGRSIRQDEYLPTRKRASLESLDELISICASQTQVCDPRPVKCRRESLAIKLAKSANVNPQTIPADPGEGDKGAPVSENRNSGSDICSPEADDCVPASKVCHTIPVQYITPIVKSNRRKDFKSCQMSPSTTAVIQHVPSYCVSSSSRQESLIVTDRSTNTVFPRDPDCSDATDVKPLVKNIAPNASHDNMVTQGNANPCTTQMQIPVITNVVESTWDALSGATAGPSEARPSSTGSSGPGRQIPRVSNRFSRYSPILPAVGSNTVPSSLPPASENVGQSYPLQFYLPRAANQVPFGGYPTVAGWLNLQAPCLLQQPPYQETLLPRAANGTNDATYYVPIPAAYYGGAITLLPVNSQRNGSSSHPCC
ncbi:uncharacterized protein LOC144007131 isoform X2 [Festucalex cinctus]